MNLAPIRASIHTRLADLTPADRDSFMARFDRYAADAAALLSQIYGDGDDFAARLQSIFLTAANSYCERPGDLKALDARHEANPRWHQDAGMVGGVCYVDLFAGTVAGVWRENSLFQGTWPDLSAPDAAVSLSRRQQRRRLRGQQLPRGESGVGHDRGLADLAADLRGEGISLVLDFVFNHTSDEHDWALRALERRQGVSVLLLHVR